MSATCARCGLEQGPNWETQCNNQQGWGQDEDSWAKLATIQCRDRQIAAQAALLRSVTGKLEEAAGLLDNETLTAAPEVKQAAALISSVLEVLA